MPQPEYPILFYKPATALSGPADPIPVPFVAQEGTGLDHECELVIVIGKRCSDVSESDALNYVLGYSVGNDVSHRDWQIKRGGTQWSHGKGFDGWAPYGPGIASTDTIKDPHQLKIWTKVNGETRQVRYENLAKAGQHKTTLTVVSYQNGTTADLIFGVEKTVSLLSRGVTLMPGDVIFTGT